MGARFNVPLVIAVLLGLAGVLLTLQNFELLALGDVQPCWPLLVAAFGLSRIVERRSRLTGAVLLIVGGGVLLSNLGPFPLPGYQWVRYWPLIVAAAGVRELARPPEIRPWVEGLAIVCLAGWLQLSYFGAVHISTFRLWPLVLVAIGGAMLSRAVRAPEPGSTATPRSS